MIQIPTAALIIAGVLSAAPPAALAPPTTVSTIEAAPAVTAAAIDRATALLPEPTRGAVAASVRDAGSNAPALLEAITSAPKEHRPAVAFLIANMPPRDRKTLESAFLLKNIALAYQALGEVPWGKTIPQDIFFNYVLPYVNLNETRDDWRADFHKRFLPAARDSRTIEQTVLTLNRAVFDTLNVRYHATKRPKPDQSPYESTEAGFASCTGLSILLTDALRSVGVPARVTGTPLWANKSGNHTWVEIWNGQWHHVGAAEPAPLNKTWFDGIAAQADASKPEHRIYAASFGHTGVLFPLVWDETIDYVHAVDVTARYVDVAKP